jgi:CRP-like cAMP-binding protein
VRPDRGQLRATLLFEDLSDEDRQRSASWMEVRRVEPGKRITPQGASGYEFFVSAEGSADVLRDGVLIGSLAAGDFFGEIAKMSDGRRVADVVATSPMTIFAMFGTRFRELEAELPDVAARIRSTLEARLSSA